VKRIWRAGAIGALACALLAASAAPVAAIKLNGAGMYSSYSFGVTQTGIVVIIDADSETGVGVTVGLKAGASEVLMVLDLRSIGCQGMPRRANRIARLAATTNGHGALFRTWHLSASINFEEIKSLWLKVGNERSCSTLTSFERPDHSRDTDAVLAARTGRGELGNSALIVEHRPNGRERITFAYDRAQAGDDYGIELHSAKCGEPGMPVASIALADAAASGFVRHSIDISRTQLSSIRSVRIRNTSKFQPVRCLPAWYQQFAGADGE
jgi:hypothetical protein